MLHQLWENPIFVRARQVEERALNGGLKAFLHRYGVSFMLLLGPLGLCLSLTSDLRTWDRDVLAPALAFSGFMLVIYFTFKALGSTLGAVSVEKEQRTYDPLLGTLLGPREVVAGKLASALWPVFRELAGVAPAALVLGSLAGAPVETASFVLLCGASVLFFGLLGLWASFAANSTRRASRVATTLAALCILGGPMVDSFFAAALGACGPESIRFCTFSSPLAAAGFILSGEPAEWITTLAFYALVGGLLWTHCARWAQKAEDR
ncbi:MAG: hypothetical protein HY319_05990 [Armatimonadetes bacterium]|nr:hypothetical protein [Armatimonadota bacterium]